MPDPVTIRVGPEPAVAADVSGAGPAVLFLHGVGGNRSNWTDQLAALSAGHLCVAPDLRGYGGSEDYDGPFDFADASADLARLLDHLGARRACLVGLSLGGRIALDFYRRHPARVGALVLADTSAGSPESRDPSRIEAFLAIRRRPLLEDGKTPADIAPEVARSLTGPHCTPGQRARIEASLAALRTVSYLKTLEAATRMQDFAPFERIGVPTLALGGEDDRIAPPEALAAMARAIPGGEHVVIPRAGHLSNIEQPEAFNAAVAAFLARAWPA